MGKKVVSRAAASRKPNFSTQTSKERICTLGHKDDDHERGTEIVLRDKGGAEMTTLSTQSGSDSLGPEPEPDVVNGAHSAMEAMIMGSIDLSTMKKNKHSQSDQKKRESRVQFKDDDLPAYGDVPNGSKYQTSNT